MPFDKEQKLRDNIEAVRTVLRLEVEQRVATAPERETISKYAGFGGIKCILNDANDFSDKEKWPKSEQKLFEPVFELRQMLRDYAKDDKEFKTLIDSLKASTLTSFYTHNKVADAITDSLTSAGVELTRVLEPSAGTGVFVSSLLKKENFPMAEITAFEKDLLTGKMLAPLNPRVKAEIRGFETIEKEYKGYFDAAVGNVPFGDFAVADPHYATSKDIAFRQSTKSIHNYFFLKSLDQVRDGGLVAFIAPQGVMNQSGPFIRMQLVKEADLVGALRLPNNTFSENAGTDVGSDLIILQKHDGKKRLSTEEEYFVQSVVDRDTKVPGNRYFQEFPQNIVCTDAKVGTDPYGKPALIYTHRDGVEGIARDIRETLRPMLEKNLDLERYNSQGMSGTDKSKTQSKPETQVQKPEEKKVSMQEQWLHMKKKHPDAIVLMRVGDFYETFGEDAKAASDILNITLTRRSLGKNKSIELAGFPHHALDVYLPKLVRSGRRVAIAEQLEAPKRGVQKKSEVKEVVTPGKKVDAPKPEPKPEVKNDTPKSEIKNDTPKAGAKPEVKPDTPKTEAKPEAPKRDIQDVKAELGYDPRWQMYNLFGELMEVPGAVKELKRRGQWTKADDKAYHKAAPKAEYAPAYAEPAEQPKERPSLRRRMTKEELDFYGALNWDDNPPINGFYETMMVIAQKQLEEIRREKELEAQRKLEEAMGRTTLKLEELDTVKETVKPRVAPERQEKTEAAPAEKKPEVDLSPRPYADDLKPWRQNGSMAVQDGMAGFLSDVGRRGATFTPLALNREQTEKAMLYVTLSDTYQQLYRYESATREANADVREHLNRYYDDFVQKYGHLNDPANRKFILMDALGRESLALEREENGRYFKADIFSQPVSFSVKEEQRVL